MLFNSLEFAIFFPLVVAIHFLLPHRLRWLLLLVASYWFYMAWKAEYAVLLLLSTAVDYTAANGIHRAKDQRGRKRWLWMSLVVNLGLLGFFKYFNFLNDTFRTLSGWGGIDYSIPDMDLLLPMGISFYTFQTMSYTIDVYRGHLQPERHLGRFALFVTFFPQLVAGPVVRAPDLLPQFIQRMGFDQQRVVEGLKRMLWGLFKKVVIADRCAPIVDEIFGDPAAHDGPLVVLGVLLFSIQIYCDFSGYSDIAIGSARVLGFRIMENFRAPQLAASIGEFWSRWHISMSAWFRDYIYIPLGGNRVNTERWYFNLVVVFFLSGIWHGAGWTFVIYGLLHGAYMVLALMTKRHWRRFNAWSGLVRIPRLHHAMLVLVTFLLVAFSRIFFRAESVQDAFVMLGSLWHFKLAWGGLPALFAAVKPWEIAITLVLAFSHLFLDHHLEAFVKGERRFGHRAYSYLFHGSLLLLLVLFGNYGEVAFIYFQF